MPHSHGVCHSVSNGRVLFLFPALPRLLFTPCMSESCIYRNVSCFAFSTVGRPDSASPVKCAQHCCQLATAWRRAAWAQLNCRFFFISSCRLLCATADSHTIAIHDCFDIHNSLSSIAAISYCHCRILIWCLTILIACGFWALVFFLCLPCTMLLECLAVVVLSNCSSGSHKVVSTLPTTCSVLSITTPAPSTDQSMFSVFVPDWASLLIFSNSFPLYLSL